MSRIGRYLSTDVHLQLGYRVMGLKREENTWWVQGEGGQEDGPYDGVLLTCPGPQSAALLPDGMSLKVRAETLSYAPSWTLLVTCKTSVPLPYDGIQLTDSPIGWMARNNSKPGRPEQECWVVQGAPEWSRQHVDQAADEVQTLLLSEFKKLSGAEPVRVMIHRWLYALSEHPDKPLPDYMMRTSE